MNIRNAREISYKSEEYFVDLNIKESMINPLYVDYVLIKNIDNELNHNGYILMPLTVYNNQSLKNHRDNRRCIYYIPYTEIDDVSFYVQTNL